MKLLSILGTVATFLLPLLPGTEAIFRVYRTIGNTPESGLKDITFPSSIASACHETGYSLVHEFYFVNSPSDSAAGAISLSPLTDAKDGTSIVNATFSSSVPGTTTSDKNCEGNGDGGAAVSCRIKMSTPFDPVYNLRVQKTGDRTWTGTLVDTETGNSTRIGTFTLPEGTGDIHGNHLQSLSFDPWNRKGTHGCTELPYTNVAIRRPFTETAGAGDVKLNSFAGHGCCVGRTNLTAHELVNQTVDVAVGYVDPSRPMELPRRGEPQTCKVN